MTRARIQFNFMIFGIFILTGCTTIVFTGHKISLKDVAKFEPYVTTKAEVEEILGPPGNIIENASDQNITYTYLKVTDKTVTLIPFIRRATSGQVLDITFEEEYYTGHVLTELNQGLLNIGKK